MINISLIARKRNIVKRLATEALCIIFKRLNVVLFVFTTFYSITISAQTLSDVARATTLTWYGVDFSEARFVNFGKSLNSSEIKKSLGEWSLNPLGGYESFIKNKYDLKKLEVDLTHSEKRNRATDFERRIVSESYSLTADDVQKIVSEYNITGSGYGVLLVVEGFDHHSDNAYVWVAFIDKQTKKVISTRRFICEHAGGWSKAIKKAIKLSSDILRHSN